MPTITLTLPVAGQDADAGPLATNFFTLQSLLNGNIDAVNLADDSVGLNELSASGTPDATKFLRGDNSWAAPSAFSMPTPATTLPGSPTNGQLAILTDSLTAPSYQWLCQYDTSITDTYKWRVTGGSPIVSMGNGEPATSGYSTFATVTAPRSGNYKAIGSLAAGNSAIATEPRARNNGSVLYTHTASAITYSKTMHLHYAGYISMSAGTAFDVQANGNGSDGTNAVGWVSLMPVRII